MKDKTAKPWKSRQKPCEKVRLSVPFAKAQNTAAYNLQPAKTPKHNVSYREKNRFNYTLKQEWTNNFWRETMVEQQQSTTQQHWAAWATNRSESKKKNCGSHCNSPCGSPGLWVASRWGMDPRCQWSSVSPLFGWSCESADGTVCARLVVGSTPHFHPYSPPGSDTKRGSQKKGEWLSLSLLTPFPSPPSCKGKHTYQKPHPPTL